MHPHLYKRDLELTVKQIIQVLFLTWEPKCALPVSHVILKSGLLPGHQKQTKNQTKKGNNTTDYFRSVLCYFF